MHRIPTKPRLPGGGLPRRAPLLQWSPRRSCVRIEKPSNERLSAAIAAARTAAAARISATRTAAATRATVTARTAAATRIAAAATRTTVSRPAITRATAVETPRSPDTPSAWREPGTEISLRPWKLQRLEECTAERTRPPLWRLALGDPRRERRRTSPRLKQPSPELWSCHVKHASTQTSPQLNKDQGTSPILVSSDETSEEEPLPEKYGPIRVTLTSPHIAYRERLIK